MNDEPQFCEQILCVLKAKISSAYISKMLADIESRKNDKNSNLRNKVHFNKYCCYRV